jgi:hypothetical protein
MGHGNSGFVKGKCEKTNCFISTSKEDLESSDALVFHGQDLQGQAKFQQLKMLSHFKREQKKKEEKSPLFVYFMKEPPHADIKPNHSVFKVTSKIF